MREILFRAKNLDDWLTEKSSAKWFYGDLMHDGGESCAMYFHEDGSDMQVDPDTVGQFTGMGDCDGKEIYEGDILENSHGTRAEVVWNQGCWCMDFHDFDLSFDRVCLYDFLTSDHVQIIGNIHDNPELMQNK